MIVRICTLEPIKDSSDKNQVTHIRTFDSRAPKTIMMIHLSDSEKEMIKNMSPDNHFYAKYKKNESEITTEQLAIFKDEVFTYGTGI